MKEIPMKRFELIALILPASVLFILWMNPGEPDNILCE